jgi:hypothetical protein
VFRTFRAGLGTRSHNVSEFLHGTGLLNHYYAERVVA